VVPRFRCPSAGAHRESASGLAGAIVAILAGLLPIGLVGELVSIGTLFAFAAVCLGVLVLRLTHPEIHRLFFKTPAVFAVALPFDPRSSIRRAHRLGLLPKKSPSKKSPSR
jgi:hypothetical protein